MEKYSNKSPVMKILHKYTGFIICGIILAVVVPMYINETSNFEFFERWTCPQLQIYLLLENDSRYPSHDELTPQQHEKLHQVLSECTFENDIAGLNHK